MFQLRHFDVHFLQKPINLDALPVPENLLQHTVHIVLRQIEVPNLLALACGSVEQLGLALLLNNRSDENEIAQLYLIVFADHKPVEDVTVSKLGSLNETAVNDGTNHQLYQSLTALESLQQEIVQKAENVYVATVRIRFKRGDHFSINSGVGLLYDLGNAL
jgi:hypothetical protein